MIKYWEVDMDGLEEYRVYTEGNHYTRYRFPNGYGAVVKILRDTNAPSGESSMTVFLVKYKYQEGPNSMWTNLSYVLRRRGLSKCAAIKELRWIMNLRTVYG